MHFGTIPKTLVDPKMLPIKTHRLKVITKGKGVCPFSTGANLLLVDEDARSELHYIRITDVHDIRIESSMKNTASIWLAPDDGEWELERLLITDESSTKTFLVNATIGTDATPAIALGQHNAHVIDTDTLDNNQEYIRLQKHLLDTQLVAYCGLNIGCLFVNPNYSFCLLMSSTVGTIYLYLLGKQVESWGKYPLISIVSYQARMLLVNAFIIYSFMTYHESRDLNYLFVSAIGFLLYRITLISISKTEY